MFSGPEIVGELQSMGITHVVWVPDSVLGRWEPALQSTPNVSLVRVCREGEAWPLAAGLHIAGAHPLVMMQTTGLFESGDALRNVLYDLGIPIFALIGARNWLNTQSTDTARRFAQPILEAWQVAYVVIDQPSHKARLAEHYAASQAAQRPGIVLLAE